MRNDEKIFELLKASLIEWSPRVKDLGFDDTSVRKTGDSIPADPEFDYVFFSQPTLNMGMITTGGGKVQRSTETYAIDIFTKRKGVGMVGDLASLNALNDITYFIADLFAPLGFVVVVNFTDNKYLGNSSTKRRVLTITKTFINL